MWVAYSRIGDYLAARARAGERLVTLASPSVEALLGRRRPRQARTERAWWSNDPPHASHAIGAGYRWYGWLSVGWQAEPDQESQAVTFRYRREDPT